MFVMISDNLPPDKQEIVEDNAITLYGLIHSRYIITGVGLQKMVSKVLYHVSCDVFTLPSFLQ
jgi:hypothetical protein